MRIMNGARCCARGQNNSVTGIRFVDGSFCSLGRFLHALPETKRSGVCSLCWSGAGARCGLSTCQWRRSARRSWSARRRWGHWRWSHRGCRGRATRGELEGTTGRTTKWTAS